MKSSDLERGIYEFIAGENTTAAFFPNGENQTKENLFHPMLPPKKYQLYFTSTRNCQNSPVFDGTCSGSISYISVFHVESDRLIFRSLRLEFPFAVEARHV